MSPAKIVHIEDKFTAVRQLIEHRATEAMPDAAPVTSTEASFHLRMMPLRCSRFAMPSGGDAEPWLFASPP